MRKILVLWILFASATSFAQDCQLNEASLDYYKNYCNPISYNKIIENWDGYFGENLDNFIPLNYPNINSFSIKFDGIGCIYPEFFDENFRFIFKNKKQKESEIDKNSFYEVYFSSGIRKQHLIDILKLNGFDNLVNDIAKINQHTPEGSFNYKSYFDFNSVWNSYFIPRLTKNLNVLIDSSEIKNIVYFVHGFNVPYSLAKIQTNLIIEKAYELKGGSESLEKTLFVPIYWNSGNRKKILNKALCLRFENKEDFKTKTLYSHISNSAYFASIGFRQILKETIDVNSVKILTHSHSATLATSALIRTKCKLDKSLLKNLFIDLTNRYELPEKQIDVFINAPAIPGVSTFIDINRTKIIDFDLQRKYFWNVGFNCNDKTLLKQKIPLKLLKNIKLAKISSSTTLGCNRKNEIYKTQAIFKKLQILDNFNPIITGNQESHDFFCYFQQKEFNLVFENFMKK